MNNSNVKQAWTTDDMVKGEYKNFIRICADEDLTLKKLADMYGVSPRTIGRWKQRWATEIEEYQVIHKTKDEFDNGEAHTREDHNFHKDHDDLCTEILESIIPEDLDDDINIYKDTSKFSYTFTITKNSLSIDQYSAEDGLITNHCDKSNPVFQEFLSNVFEDDLSEEQEQKLLANYWLAMKPALGLETFTRGRIKVDINSRQITFIDDDGQEYLIDNRLTDKIVQTYLGNEPVEHLITFLDNLMNNTSKRTIDNLYSFLAFNDIKITDDGCFTAWKVINYDYTDCYTRTIDNSPGRVITMPRSQVDDDPAHICSTGLHVCAAHYIPHFSRFDNKIVKVKVDPKDVISVPVDYEFAKMRTCRYEVLEEIVDVDEFVN